MPTLRELLKGKIPDELLQYVPRSYELIGSRAGAVAIVEIPEELEPYKRLIGEAIAKINKNVKTVLRKVSGRKGVFRVRDYEVIWGSGETEVLHKEHGYVIKVDPTKVYFSAREATERVRIARQVRPGEFIMYMFAGVGPFAIAICKFQPRVKKIVAIELNPIAFRYMLENIKLNKIECKILPVLGDVRDHCPRWFGKCDRVLMPLPKGAHEFLDLAFKCLKPEGGIIHFYHWSPEERLFEDAEEIVREYANKLGYEVKVLDRRIVSEYAPRVYKVVLDIYARKASE